MPPLLVVRDLHKVYEAGLGRCVARVEVLRGVSFTLNTGERLAIIGAPASGKTTLLHCLAGLRQVSSGEIHWTARPRNDEARAVCTHPEQLLLYRTAPLLIDLSAEEHSIVEWAEQLRAAAPASWILVARRLGPITHLCDTVAALEEGLLRPRSRVPMSRRVAESLPNER